jgi:RTX calcium-binding nonapeptide repeat (4 copies)
MDSSGSAGLVGARARRGLWLALALTVLAALPSAAAAAPPANDDFADAQDLTSLALPIEVDGTTVEATRESGEPNHLETTSPSEEPAGPGHSVWYEWRANVDGPVTVAAPQAVIAIYTGDQLNALTWVAGNYPEGPFSGGFQIGLDSFWADGDETYRIAVDSTMEEPFELTIREPNSPANDNFKDARSIKQRGERIPLIGNNVEATGEPGDPNLDFGYRYSAWFRWRPLAHGRVTFPHLPGCGNPDLSTPLISVYTGTRVDGLSLVEVGCTGEETFVADAAKIYRISVSSRRREWGNFKYGRWGNYPAPSTWWELTQELSCRGRTVTIGGTRGPDRVRGTPGPDVIASFGGKDRISAGRGRDLVCAGAGNDIARGGPGIDTLRGAKGRDRLLGGPGPDRLFGGGGRDICKGGEGNDSGFACEMKPGI